MTALGRPTALERLVWDFGDGSTLQAVDTPRGKLGAVICWANYTPALRMAMYQQGVAIYCVPTADNRDTWQSTMQRIVLEGRCFVPAPAAIAVSGQPHEQPAARSARDGADARRKHDVRPPGPAGRWADLPRGCAVHRRARPVRHPDGEVQAAAL